jgi:hypothetical protein
MEASIVQPRTTNLPAVRSLLWAVVLVATGLPVACGDEQGDRTSRAAAAPDDPSALVERYYAALTRGDGAAACGLMTNAGQEGMKQLPAGERPDTCERAVAALARESVHIRHPRLEDLRISGDTATANVVSTRPRQRTGVLLRREDGGWKIAYPPAVVNRFKTPPGIRPHEDENDK